MVKSIEIEKSEINDVSSFCSRPLLNFQEYQRVTEARRLPIGGIPAPNRQPPRLWDVLSSSDKLRARQYTVQSWRNAQRGGTRPTGDPRLAYPPPHDQRGSVLILADYNEIWQACRSKCIRILSRIVAIDDRSVMKNVMRSLEKFKYTQMFRVSVA